MSKSKSRANMKRASLLFGCSVFSCLILFQSSLIVAQTQSGETQSSGVVQLKVKPKINGKDKELARKRFFLIKGSLEENKDLIGRINQQRLTSRDCFYRAAKASEAFINWLKDGDCESVYCRPIEEQFLAGPGAVPEFQNAFEKSVKEYKSRELGRLWLTTNLTNETRDGFYRQTQAVIKALMSDVTTTTRSEVASVMTDRKGTAYFTNIAPGTYIVTNLVPTELGETSAIWMCEVKVGEGKKRIQIPAKCVVVEKPLPACNASSQTASTK